MSRKVAQLVARSLESEFYCDIWIFQTILALANRYLTINKLVECKQLCEMALSIDKNNDEATLVRIFTVRLYQFWLLSWLYLFQMVADMLYTNNDTDKAIVHFAQLLEKYPSEFIIESFLLVRETIILFLQN